MGHAYYGSTEEMLASDNLSAIAGVPIRQVRTHPLRGGAGATASRFVGIETNDGQGPRLVLKRLSWETNWIMRATEDRHGRETLLWQSGLTDQLPPDIDCCVLACSHDADGWALLMRDVADTLLPAKPFDQPTQALILNGLAALHATFWEQAESFGPSSGFCSLWHYYASLSATIARREARSSDDFPSVIARGWEVLDHVIAPDLARTARSLSEDPDRLCRALARYPHTLVHRDLNLGNVGVARGQRTAVILLDWQFAGRAPPCGDLGNYLSEFSGWLPCSKEETIEQYRDLLADHLGSRFSDRWWKPQCALSLLGEFVRLAWAYAFHIAFDRDANRREWYESEVAWWSGQVYTGLRWL